MEIIEAEVLSGCADIVYTAGEVFNGSLELLPRLDLALGAVLLDVVGDRSSDMELMGVGVRVLGLLQLEDLPGPNLKVLLRRDLRPCRRVTRG